LIPARFTPNPAFDAKEEENIVAPFICPITLIEVGRHRFSLLKSCGCVLSERALREVPSKACLQCGKSFTVSDIITLNPSVDEVDDIRKNMNTRRRGEKLEKRGKTEKKRDKKANDSTAEKLIDGTSDVVENSMSKSKILAERVAQKKRIAELTTTTTSVEPSAKTAKTAAYASIFTSSIKPDPNARMQETFMCRNVLRG